MKHSNRQFVLSTLAGLVSVLGIQQSFANTTVGANVSASANVNPSAVISPVAKVAKTTADTASKVSNKVVSKAHTTAQSATNVTKPSVSGSLNTSTSAKSTMTMNGQTMPAMKGEMSHQAAGNPAVSKPSITMNKPTTSAISAAVKKPAPVTTTSNASAKVNINTADVAGLQQALKGIGEKKAQAIVAYRKAHGPFKQLSDLQNVPGVGVTIVSNNKAHIQV